MIYNLIITVLLISAFFMCIKAYYMGFKHAKSLQKEIIPTIIPNPIKAFEEVVAVKEEKKKADEVYEGWHGEKGIMNYDPYNVKEGENG